MRHVKNIRESNINNRLISYCGKPLSENVWHFTGVDHVTASIEADSYVVPCKKCLKKIRGILKDKLKK